MVLSFAGEFAELIDIAEVARTPCRKFVHNKVLSRDEAHSDTLHLAHRCPLPNFLEDHARNAMPLRGAPKRASACKTASPLSLLPRTKISRSLVARLRIGVYCMTAHHHVFNPMSVERGQQINLIFEHEGQCPSGDS